MATKEKKTLNGDAAVRFTKDESEAKASINGEVMASVARQVATETNEKAVFAAG